MRRRRLLGVPPGLVVQIERAEAEVHAARAHLDQVKADGAPLWIRADAHAWLASAFADADTVLRRAVSALRAESSNTRPGSFVAWSRWRRRLSVLTSAREAHRHEQADDLGVLPPFSVRAVDTGMLAPDVGDLMYGQSKEPGAPALIGVDLGVALDGSKPPTPERLRTATPTVSTTPATTPVVHTTPPEPAAA